MSVVQELRKEIKQMIKQDSAMKLYIKAYETFTGLKYSSKLTESQLNDLITWCTNEQLVAERRSRESIKGII